MTLHQALRHFGQLVVGGTGFYSAPFRAPLLALAFVVVLGFLVLDLIRGRDAVAILLETTYVLGMLAWWYLDFYRYAALFEMSAPGVLLVLLLRHGLLPNRGLGVAAVAALTGLGMVGLLSDPGRVWQAERSGFRGSYLNQSSAQLAGLPSHLLLTTAAPTGSVVAFLPSSTTVVRLGGNLGQMMSPRWWLLTQHYVLAHGDRWEVVFDEEHQDEAAGDLRLADLAGTFTDCEPFPSRLLLRQQNRLRMCAVTVSPTGAPGGT